MKFKEILRAVGEFAQEQKEARKARLEHPELKRKLENLQENMKDDLRNACMSGAMAVGRLTIGAPLIGLWEGFIGTPVKILGHNVSERDKTKKKKYPNVIANTIAEILMQYYKGGINVLEIPVHLTKMLGKSVIYGGRYLIGK